MEHKERGLEMLEKLFAQAKNGVQKQSQKLGRRLPFFSSGIWIVIAVTVLVGGRLLWVDASRPAHRQAIADAFGSIVQYFGEAQLNHDGSQLTYVSTADEGYGVFLYDQTTGQRQLIGQQNHQGPLGNFCDLNVWAWSPDDHSFIYSVGYNLFVCSIESGKISQSEAIDVHGPAIIPDDGWNPCLTSVVWVNPGVFAYLFDGVIGYAKKQPDGQWITYRLPCDELPNAGGASCLTAAPNDSIAWLMNGVIFRAHLTEDINGVNDSFTVTPATATAQRKLEANIKAVTFAAAPGSQPPTDHLVFWCDASTLQQSNQSSVLRLADLSPGKNDLIPNGKAPTYNEPGSPRTLNKRGTIHFSLNGSVTNATGLRTITSLGITNDAPRTVFAVMHREVGSQMLLGMGDSDLVGGYFGLCDQNDGLYLPSAGASGNLTPPSDGSWMITEVVYDGKTQRAYVNGQLRGVTTFPLNTTAKEFELGLRTGASAAGSAGDFAELLVYDQALSPAARQQVENYLNLKWFGNSLLLPGNPAVWCEPPIPGLLTFNYSKQNGQLLIKQAEANGRNALWRFDPRSDNPDNATRIVEAGSISGEQWAGPRDCLYASSDRTNQGLVVTDVFGPGNTRRFQPQTVNWFKVTDDGAKLFFGGTISNEPSVEIAQIDLDSGQMRTAVSYADHPSTYAKAVQLYNVSMQLPSGRTVTCLVFPPANFNPHKKYPLVLGDTMFVVALGGSHVRCWVPTVSSCGAFVIYINRGDWWQGMDQWEPDILGIYHCLAKDPCIDRRRVFLFATSAETTYLSRCVEQHPGMWAGAIIMGPGQLPDFSKSPPIQSRPRILISTGGQDNYNDEAFKRYQAESLKSGVKVEYVIHPDEGHVVVGNAALLERTRAIMHFIFDE